MTDRSSTPFLDTRTMAILAVIVVAVVTAGLWLNWYAYQLHLRSDKYVMINANLRKPESYRSTIFPAQIPNLSVDFQRGPSYQLEVNTSWPGHPNVEIANCPDDTEGEDFAEFHLNAQQASAASYSPTIPPPSFGPVSNPTANPNPLPFATIAHPRLKARLESALFFARDSVTKPANWFEKAIILKGTPRPYDWTTRVTLIPSPFGAAVQPEGLTPEQAAEVGTQAVPDEPKLRSATPDPRSYGPNARRRAEEAAERQYNEDKRYYLNRYHHLYMVEAARDFGNGRIVVLRRIGLVLSPSTITRAEATIKKMRQSMQE